MMEKVILVIDDDEPMTWLLEKFLGRHYKVVTKPDGLSAMIWLKDRNIPDLIISDIKMPEIDGLEFLINLKKSGLYRDIPVIMFSGWGSSDQRAAALENGALHFLEKPFNPEHLLELVKEAFESDEITMTN
ncbi:MAG: response regulator [Bacteroidota bacterium]